MSAGSGGSAAGAGLSRRTAANVAKVGTMAAPFTVDALCYPSVMSPTRDPLPILGLVGGLGPESTIDYYRRILEAWEREAPGTAPLIVIDSLDVRLGLRPSRRSSSWSREIPRAARPSRGVTGASRPSCRAAPVREYLGLKRPGLREELLWGLLLLAVHFGYRLLVLYGLQAPSSSDND